jgi:hypothetical protein
MARRKGRPLSGVINVDHQDPVMTFHLPGGKSRSGSAPRFHRQGGHGMPSPGEGDKLSFERDIKPLFRTKDRDSMRVAFDLFDYADVTARADAIVGSLRSGQMPCDGAWPAEQVDKLQQWIDEGKLA